MDLKTLWSEFSPVKYPTYNNSYQMPIIDGQSLAQGYTGAGASFTRFYNRSGSKQIDGLKRSDGVNMNVEGPRSLTYGPETSTGIKYVELNSASPAVLTFAAALDKWRQKLKRPQYQMVIGFNGFIGRPINEFDDDNPVTGINGTHIRDNHYRWMQEVLAQIPSIYPTVYGMIQGEADRGLSKQEYYNRATKSYSDALDDIEELTNVRPPLMLWQTGGYVTNNNNPPYGSTLAQLDLIKDFNGVFAGPLYPALIRDNNVHPTLEAQIIWSEIGAWVFLHHEMGQNKNLLPGTPEVIGNQIMIPMSVDTGKSLTFDGLNKYAQYGGIKDHGIEISGTTVESVVLNEDKLIIRGGAPLSGRTVKVAMQGGSVENQVDNQGRNYGTHRCDIMESAPEDSLILPGVKLRRYIPSMQFEV